MLETQEILTALGVSSVIVLGKHHVALRGHKAIGMSRSTRN